MDNIVSDLKGNPAKRGRNGSVAQALHIQRFLYRDIIDHSVKSAQRAMLARAWCDVQEVRQKLTAKWSEKRRGNRKPRGAGAVGRAVGPVQVERVAVESASRADDPPIGK
jgi:hypothetical protein